MVQNKNRLTKVRRSSKVQVFSEHTTGHLACPACNRRRTLAMQATISPGTLFAEAARLWLDSRTFNGNSRSRFVAPRTLKDFAQYIAALDRFFGMMPVSQIHLGHIRSYQEQRSATCGPNKINQEVGTLVRVLKRSECWTAELEEHYEPLQHEETDIARALTPAEQERWLDVAGSLPGCALVHWYSLLAFSTTMSGHEMRGLQIGDVRMAERIIMVRVRGAKNKYRIRTIPMTDDASWAAQRILELAHRRGAREPQHYLFPFREVRNSFNPAKAMTESGLKKPWDEVRSASGLKAFRIHDTRHTAITRLAEAGTPVPVIMSMAGHISRRMWQHYTQISEQAKRQALEAAFGGRYGSNRKAPERSGVDGFGARGGRDVERALGVSAG
jgi:integrase